MPEGLILKPSITLGVVPTHVKFVGCLAPVENDEFPREPDEPLLCVAEMDRICQQPLVRPSSTKISVFPGDYKDEASEMIVALEALRTLKPRHRIDNTDGRTYTKTVIDGLTNITRRLNTPQTPSIL